MSKIYQKTHPAGKNAGFTLIELLVVVLIIGILAAVALPKYQQAVNKTRLMSLLPLLRSISDAENLYYLANNTYSLDFSELDISLPAGGKVTSEKKVEYDQFECNLGSRSGGYSAYCNSIFEGMPQLEKYFDQSYFVCWAWSDEQINLCRAISGSTSPDYISSNGAKGFYLGGN